jgi:endonuclease/exonuclease/phosphatase family metal-dependent hydrolase
MLRAMRRIPALVLSLSLPLALVFSACPGPNQDFNVPPPDADTNPPDSAVEAEAGPPQPVKVMTWNVHNFYNDKRDSFEVAEADEMVLTPAEYQTKLTQVSSVVGSVKPDVLVLQEVENQAVIDDLAAKLGGYPNRFITQGNDPRGIDIAVLSELPLQVAPTHRDEFFHPSTDPSQTFVFARDVLEAHFMINTRHFVLLGIHLKAQDGDPKSDLKRLAEAEQVRAIATGIQFGDANAAITVLGDFNDTPGSAPLTALMGSPPFQLTSAAAQVPAAERYSVTFGGNPQLFDDQLSDPIAASKLDPASVTILHSGDVNLASDHDPVIATYMVN